MTDVEVLVEYLRRSYQAVDGLWFVKVEESLGFAAALSMDVSVWAVLAKIQARKARALLQVQDNSLAEFVRCFTLKLEADGFTFTPEVAQDEARFIIATCPWLDILRGAGREQLAAPISGVMCPTEAQAWCQEFGGEIGFALEACMCQGDDGCRMVFSRRTPA